MSAAGTISPKQPSQDVYQQAMAQQGTSGVATGDTGRRATAAHARLAKRVPKSPVTSKLFNGYEPSGVKVQLSEIKIGIMPELSDCVSDIAEFAGVNLADKEQAAMFLEALVADVYVNAYSDKMDFSGYASLDDEGSYRLPRSAIKRAIEPRVGTNHRRFARAMATLVVQVMSGNSQFDQLLDRRCAELNLSTREEAVQQFDGNEGLSILDRNSAKRAAEVKALALSARASHRSYGLYNSAATSGDHSDVTRSELQMP